MVVRTNVRSTVEKPSVYYDEHHVYVVNGQKAVSENVGKDDEFIGFEVAEEIEYEKDEYIELQAQQVTSCEDMILELSEVVYA